MCHEFSWLPVFFHFDFMSSFSNLCLMKLFCEPCSEKAVTIHPSFPGIGFITSFSKLCSDFLHADVCGYGCVHEIVKQPFYIHQCIPLHYSSSPPAHHFWGKSLRLRFFGHLARTAPKEDHHHVIAATLRPPAEWRRPVGRPRTTWLRTIDDDLQSLNFGVHTAWRKARGRDIWHQVVSMAMLHHGVRQ